MKRTLFALLFTAGIASASQVPNPILRYSHTGGFTPPGVSAPDEHCDIYGASVTYRASSKVAGVRYPTVYTKDLPNEGAVLNEIREVKKGTYKKSEGPTDGPTSRYWGILTIGAGAPDPVMLSQSGQENITSSKTKSVAKLIEVVVANCQPKPEVLALLASEDYKLALEEVVKQQPDGYTAVVTGHSVLKIGKKDTFVYANLQKKNLKSGKLVDHLGSLVGTVLYKGKKIEIDGVHFSPKPEPAAP